MRILIFQIGDGGGGLPFDLPSLVKGIVLGAIAAATIKYGLSFINSINPMVGKICFVISCGYLVL
jgi:hypothetical protein